jgi:glutamate racemase
MVSRQPIGVFDSGYGGLTILKEITGLLPQYDYVYLGDNARSPYGPRSFDTVYRYTLECVQWFFNQGCSLLVLACNTASAKALRTIQQHDLPVIAPGKRVLGVIRQLYENKSRWNTRHYRDRFIWLLPYRNRKIFSGAPCLPGSLPHVGAIGGE